MTLLTSNPAPAGAGEVTVRVAEKSVIAAGVVELVLESPGGGRLPDWAPGAHVDLILPTGDVRQYSLCGDRWDPRSYRVAVLREPDGRGGSSHVHDVLQQGDLVGLGGPRNSFHLVPSQRYLFVAGGIGITPLMSMIDGADRVGADWQLVYGGRTRPSMAFLDDLAPHGDRVQIVPEDSHGRLPLAEVLGGVDEHTVAYVCGPSGLLDAVDAATTSWPAGRVRTERFTPRSVGAPVLDRPFTVELARTGTSVQVDPTTTVLDAVRRVGAVALTSCRQGTCGTCETAVLAGTPDHRDSILDDDQRAEGDRMFICVSRSCTDRLVLDL